MTSLMLLRAILKYNKKVSELSKIIDIYPQVLVNAKISNDKKYLYKEDKEIKSAIEKVEEEFSDNGRVLIRPSGTEPLIRVMIEGKDLDFITKRANEIASLIEEKLK